METKVCTSCKMEKPLSAFHHFGKHGTRIGKWCQDCYSKRAIGKPAPTAKPAHTR